MLNQDDRRRLEAIERQLQSDDPEFARRFSRWSSPGAERWRRRLVLVVVVSGFGLLLSVAVLSLPLFLVSVAGVATGWVWLRRWDRGHTGRPGPEDDDGVPRL
jgi:hypothetical protein